MDLLGNDAACLNCHFCDHNEGAGVAKPVLEDVHSEAESCSHYEQTQSLDD